MNSTDFGPSPGPAERALTRRFLVTLPSPYRVGCAVSDASFFESNLKVEVAGRIRHPDGFVTCTPGAGNSTIVRDPVVIFEVLSDGTAATDYGAKNEEYAATPSVQRYLSLSQTRISATMFARVGDDWLGHPLSAGSILRMPEIGIEVPLAEFYLDVEFAAEPEDGMAGDPRS